MLTCDEIFDRNFPASTTDADHFSNDPARRLPMMQSQTADHYIKLLIAKWELLRRTKLKAGVRNLSLASMRLGNVQHLGCQIDADDFAANFGERQRNIAWSTSYIQNSSIGVRRNGLHQLLQTRSIGDRRRLRIRQRLLREFHAHSVVVSHVALDDRRFSLRFDLNLGLVLDLELALAQGFAECGVVLFDLIGVSNGVAQQSTLRFVGSA